MGFKWILRSNQEKNLVHLNFSDVNLGYFEFIQKRVKQMFPGEVLIPTNEGCTNSKGELVLKFSKSFLIVLISLKERDYTLKNAIVNFFLFWMDHDKETEYLAILPELTLEKKI